MRFFFLAIMGAYLAGNVYLFIRFLRTLQILWALPAGYKIIISILYWIAAASLFISLFTRDANYPVWLSKSLYTIGSVWMVFTLYMVMTLLVMDLLRLAVPLFRPALYQYGFIIAFAITAGLLSYGYYNYRNPQINTLDLHLHTPSTLSPDNELAATSLKIVAVSDVHLGNGTGKKLLGKYVELINSQQPDLLLIAGDLIDNSVAPLHKEKMAEELSQLKAPMGIYMVPGNHEYISGIAKVEEFLKNTPIQLLKDSIVTLPCGITIIGRDDRSNRSRKSLEELISTLNHADSACFSNYIPCTHLTLLLDHQPYELAKTDSLGITLQISGHTHRGQVWPLNWLTDKIYEQSHGYRKWSNSHIYVSSGLSLWGPPFRIGTESEIVVVELKF